MNPPRSSVITHEASHAVVAAALGLCVMSCKIFKMKRGADRGHYNGKTKIEQGEPFVGACIAVAGIVGQKLFDDIDIHNTQFGQFELRIARRLAGSDEGVQRAVNVAAKILHENADLVRSLSAELDARELLCAGRLAELLAPIRTAWECVA